MRSRTFTSSASALLLLVAAVNAKHGVHEHLETLHARHRVHREHARSTAEDGEAGVELRSVVAEDSIEKMEIKKRDGQCVFPTGLGLVAVSPSEENAGWAMSPNQPCLPGNYCPYACPAGQVSMQWDPSATSYSYPKSMNGGLYCNEDGSISKPIPDQPYCESTTQAVIGAQNNAGQVVAFCQTVLPGNEAMLIPTSVESWTQLAVPSMSYWCETAAHYYINPPGITTDVACVWGTNENPWGNWSPYVAGGNTDANGNTFIKLGWNPIYLEAATPFRTTMPTWGVEIICDGDGCNGLPCAIDPTQNGVNEMVGSATDGAGGAAFCVVTVPQGVTANFVVSYAGGSSSSSPSSSSTPGSSSISASWSSSAQWSSSVPTFTQAQGKAGQFYGSQSSTTAASSTETTASTTPVSSSWLSHESSNKTTTHYPSPTRSPYYSLFNMTHASTSAVAGGSSVAALTTVAGPTTAAASQTTKFGAASSIKLSVVGIVASIFAASMSFYL